MRVQEAIVSPTGRVHVVETRTEKRVWAVCGQDFPARQVWTTDHMAISCKRCFRWADDRSLS